MFRFAINAAPILSLILVSFASAQGTDWGAEPVKPVRVEPDGLAFRLIAADKPGYAKIDVVALGDDLRGTMVVLGLPIARRHDTAPILEFGDVDSLCPFAVVPAAVLEELMIEVGDADLAKILLLAVARDLGGKLVFSKVTPVGALWDECFFRDAEYPNLEAAAERWDGTDLHYRLKVGVIDSRERGFLVPDDVIEGKKNEVFLTFFREAAPEQIRDPHVVILELGPEAGKLSYIYLRVANECGKSPYMLAAVVLMPRD